MVSWTIAESKLKILLEYKINFHNSNISIFKKYPSKQFKSWQLFWEHKDINKPRKKLIGYINISMKILCNKVAKNCENDNNNF
jgi:hypothetical protein